MSDPTPTPEPTAIDEADAVVLLRSTKRTLDAIEQNSKQLVSRNLLEAWQAEQELKRRNFSTLVVFSGVAFLILIGFLGYGVIQVSHLVEEVHTDSQTTVACTDPRLDLPCYQARLRNSNQQRDQQTREIVNDLAKRIERNYRSGAFSTPPPR